MNALLGYYANEDTEKSESMSGGGEGCGLDGLRLPLVEARVDASLLPREIFIDKVFISQANLITDNRIIETNWSLHPEEVLLSRPFSAPLTCLVQSRVELGSIATSLKEAPTPIAYSRWLTST
jgi:hypothetical protein